MNPNIYSSQYRGQKFGELVMQQYSTCSADESMKTVMFQSDSLPDGANDHLIHWLDLMSRLGADARMWNSDAGEIFEKVMRLTYQFFEQKGVFLAEEDATTIFQILIANFAYTAHCQPSSKAFIQKAIGVGFLGRLLG